eukprot:3976447-Prymnesium_polylepis.1
MTAAWTETFVTSSVTDSGTTDSGTSMVAPSGTATGDENVTKQHLWLADWQTRHQHEQHLQQATTAPP